MTGMRMVSDAIRTSRPFVELDELVLSSMILSSIYFAHNRFLITLYATVPGTASSMV